MNIHVHLRDFTLTVHRILIVTEQNVSMKTMLLLSIVYNYLFEKSHHLNGFQKIYSDEFVWDFYNHRQMKSIKQEVILFRRHH